MPSETSTLNLPPPKLLDLSAVALFLDLDGTLAPIAARPQDVAPDPRRTRLLAALNTRTSGRVAVVTGRTLHDVDHILERQVALVAAVHGLVRRDERGVVQSRPTHAGLDRARATLLDFARRHPGLVVEEKGPSVALHYRLARAHGAHARVVTRRIAQATGLTLQSGDMVEELRTPGPTKGDALRDFMALPNFQGATPVFVGDDITDEDGFAEAEQLGGFGVLVGHRSPTRARYALRGVDDVLAWLEAAR